MDVEAEVVVEMRPKGKSHKHWVKELNAAKKRFRKFHKQGAQVVDRFLDEARSVDESRIPSRLNLFHKNISTLCSMMYGQIPKIDVVREHYDPTDDAARVAALIIQRILQADIEPSGSDMVSVFQNSLLDRLLPGLAQCRVRYEYEAEMATTIDPMTLQPIQVEQVTDERSPIDYVHWQDFLWGWCRTWKDCPWVAFKNYMDKDEVAERFGDDIAKQLEYKHQQLDEDSSWGSHSGSEQKEVTQKAEIWEIWSKDDKKVYWLSIDHDKCLDIVDDPLELNGFFPCPKPLVANTTTRLFMPKADFVFAQDLYNEIDVLQGRISAITRAVKVVGVYDQSAGDSVGRMLKEGQENQLIPVENWAMFAEGGGLQGKMQWFPVQDVVGTLQTLQQVQQAKIEQLYEITGLSDILRGANTQQYTAAQTQAMKAKMGSIQIQALQDEFARFASDIEALKAEVVVKHFEMQSIAQQSNIEYLPQADQELVGPAMQLVKEPSLKWRINIKPESMSMMDYAQLKMERSEFLMSMAQFVQSAGPMIQQAPESAPLLLEMMKFAMVGFKGAEYLEGTMDQAIQLAAKMAQQPQGEEQQGPSPEEMKLQIEQLKAQTQQQKAAAEMQKIQMKAQADMQTLQSKLQGEIQKIQVDAQRDMALEDKQSQYALLEIAQELEAKMAEIEANYTTAVDLERAQADYDMAVNQQQHEHRLTEIQSQRRIQQ